MRICCEKGWTSFDSSWNWKSESGTGGTKADQVAKQNAKVAADFLGDGAKVVDGVVNA